MELIAIKSCHAHRYIHRSIMDTWASELPDSLEIKFFIGMPKYSMENPLSKNEVWVDAPDDYEHLTAKLHKILKYAYRKGYDHVLVCDTDTYVDVKKLVMAIPSEDFVGYTGMNGIHGAPHGCAFWVSYRAISLILNEATEENIKRYDKDEWWAYYLLQRVGIHPVHDDRYSLLTKPGRKHDAITYHSHDLRDPAKLREMWLAAR